MTEDEMVGWQHQLNGREFEQTPGDGEGQRSLACCSLWGCRVRHNLVTRTIIIHGLWICGRRLQKESLDCG